MFVRYDAQSIVQVTLGNALVAGTKVDAANYRILGGQNGTMFYPERLVLGANPGFWGLTKVNGNPGTVTVLSSNAMDVGTYNLWAFTGQGGAR